MREKPVVSGGDPEAGDHPHREEQREFCEPERLDGEESDSSYGTDDRENIEEYEVAALKAVKIRVADRLAPRNSWRFAC